MKLRVKTLWKAPVYCAAASLVSYYLTILVGRFFFVVQTMGDDGVMQVSADPVRTAIFNAVLFLAVLLIGGFWIFRSMTKAEIAVSAAVASVVYLAIVLVQILIPNSLIGITPFQNWTSILASFLIQLTDHLSVSVVLSSFAPLLFILFGKKTIEQES